MQMFAELTPDDWLDGRERKLAGVNALRVLVEGPGAGKSDPITVPEHWVHGAFKTYRAGMPDDVAPSA